MVLPIPVTGDMVYHEAGHTAMFTHYNIPIEYVSVRPDPVNHYAGMVVPAINEPTAGNSTFAV